jgi:hypothetical protein
VRNDGGHLCGPTLPQSFAVGPSKGTVGLTTSGPGCTLSSIVTYPTLLKEASASAPAVLRISAANRRHGIQQSLLSRRRRLWNVVSPPAPALCRGMHIEGPSERSKQLIAQLELAIADLEETQAEEETKAEMATAAPQNEKRTRAGVRRASTAARKSASAPCACG